MPRIATQGGWHVAHIVVGRKRGLALHSACNRADDKSGERRCRPLPTTTMAVTPMRGRRLPHDPNFDAQGQFHVWVKRVGNNPHLKLLLLHGGPGADARIFRGCSTVSCQRKGSNIIITISSAPVSATRPNDDDLWTLPRFVSEVDQVRQAIGGNKDNFCLLGHSWGGILAMEYALAHQDQLKCLIISNMMASIPAYNAYAQEGARAADEPGRAQADPRHGEDRQDRAAAYMALLDARTGTQQHILRRPADQWPDPVQPRP